MSDNSINAKLFFIGSYSYSRDDSVFLNVYKGTSTTVLVNAEDGEVLSDVKCKPDNQKNKLENRVQFRVAAVNVIGQSEWSSPFSIRVS